MNFSLSLNEQIQTWNCAVASCQHGRPNTRLERTAAGVTYRHHVVVTGTCRKGFRWASSEDQEASRVQQAEIDARARRG